jgi:hypothetical protein
VTINHLAWVVVILCCPRSDGNREREVLSTSKLEPDDKGASKTGSNIGGIALPEAISEFDAPVDHIDYCCSDTTGSNSSLRLPKSKGGTGGEGGAYAHLWAAFHKQGHILFFMIWCMSHLANNEVKEVMDAAGVCKRRNLLRKKGKRDAPAALEGVKPAKNKSRWLLAELLNDIVHAVKATKGCMTFLREEEELARLGQPPGGVVTRWAYYIDVVLWLQLTDTSSRRFELILTYLLHAWLVAEGHTGLAMPTATDNADAVDCLLSADSLAAKIELIKDDARRELLAEMTDPTIRIWLFFLAIYGKCSVKRFLNYTQNDGAGVAFKAPRVVRSRTEYLDGIADPNSDPLEHPDFEPVHTYVSARSKVYSNLDAVRTLIRQCASVASRYFQGEHASACGRS